MKICRLVGCVVVDRRSHCVELVLVIAVAKRLGRRPKIVVEWKGCFMVRDLKQYSNPWAVGVWGVRTRKDDLEEGHVAGVSSPEERPRPGVLEVVVDKEGE